jgi:hypothetical protein
MPSFRSEAWWGSCFFTSTRYIVYSSGCGSGPSLIAAEHTTTFADLAPPMGRHRATPRTRGYNAPLVSSTA